MDSKQIDHARNTDLIAFFESHCGFTFAHRGSAYRCQQHSSLAVKDDRLSWYWHSKGIGGYGVPDYLIKVENLSFPEAIETATGIPMVTSPPITPLAEKHLLLPEKGGMLQGSLVNYLCHKRKIDSGIVGALMDERMIYEDRRGNVVFVGFDPLGKARFASLRGTYGDKQFSMDCAGSNKRYGFNMSYGSSPLLYVFESPIDAMSHATLENILESNKDAWRHDNRISLSGTSDVALPIYLTNHPYVKELILCLDSDPPGREAAVAIARKYATLGFATRIELPQRKDYNEDLCAFLDRHHARTSKECVER